MNKFIFDSKYTTTYMTPIHVGDTLIGYLPMEIFEYLDKEKQSIFVTHISAAVGHDVTPDEVPEYNPLIVLHQIK